MAVDPMALLALGSGLQSLGRGLRGHREDAEEKRRYDASARARSAEADEAREFRAEQSRMTREMQREQRIQNAMSRMQEFFGRQGVVLEPSRLRQLAEADSEGPNAPPGTLDAMIGAATGAEATVPTGDEMARSPVDNGYPARPGPVPQRRRVTESVRRALEASRAQGGARVALDEDMGFARDEDAFEAARRKEQADADRAMREMVARITAGSRGGSGRESTRDALTRVERQIDDTRGDLGRVSTDMPRTTEYRDPLMGTVDTTAMNRDRAPFMQRRGELQARSDSLGGVRDSLVAELQGRTIPGTRPAAPTPTYSMDPAAKQQMDAELQEVAQMAAAILQNPRATPEQKAEAREALQEAQEEIVQRYQGARPRG